MYTILMNENKELITTRTIPLYQREKLVDEIQFIVPQTYNNLDISECTVVFRWLDIGNVIHRDVLTLTREVYKETKYKYTLPVDTKLNQFAGTINGILIFYKMNEETGTEESVLKSGETYITILPVKGIEESQDVELELVALAKTMETMKTDIEELQSVEHVELTEEDLQEAFDELGI